MTVFKAFLKNAATMKMVFIGYILLFAVMAVFNSSGGRQGEDIFVESPVYLAVVDNAKTELSKSLIQYLETKNYVDIVEDGIDELRENTYTGKYSGAIVIKKDFDELISSKRKAIEFINSSKDISSVLMGLKLKTFFSAATIVDSDGKFNIDTLNKAMNEEVKVEMLKSNSEVMDDENMKILNYFNFTAYISLAMIILIIGSVMVDFAEGKVMTRSRVSKIGGARYNISLYAGQMVLGAITIAALIALGLLSNMIFGYSLTVGKYVINLAVFTVSGITMTNLIFNISNNKNVINIASTVLSLGISFISGVMVPIKYLSSTVINVARFFPTYYFVKANEMVATQSGGVWKYLLIIIGFSLAYVILGTVIYKLKSKEI
ncbi:MAG: ABC transporter permease [Tissierellia bacterium]|nr:ABC transporter permease [Tissierellia bacterium]